MKRSVKQGDSDLDVHVERKEVLSWLKADIAWLRKKARNDNPLKNPIRVRLLRASIYGCSVYLGALKDDELEIRVKQLEEKLKDGVLIPDGTEQANKRTRR